MPISSSLWATWAWISPPEPNCSYNVMQNVKGIDLFIDGHSHTVMTASKDNSMVQSTGTGPCLCGRHRH